MAIEENGTISKNVGVLLSWIPFRWIRGYGACGDTPDVSGNRVPPTFGRNIIFDFRARYEDKHYEYSSYGMTDRKRFPFIVRVMRGYRDNSVQ